MDWIPLQYIAETDLGKIIRDHPLCIFVLLRSGCKPLGQTIVEHIYLFWTVTMLCCQACKALPGSGLDLTLTFSNLQVDSAPLSMALIERLGTFYFPSWVRGTRKALVVSSPQFKSKITGALFMHILQTHFFSPPSVVWRLFLYYMLAINNQPMVGFFLCGAPNTAFLANGAFHMGGCHSRCLLLQAGRSCQSNPNVITVPLAALHINWFAEVFCIALSSRSIVTMH